MILNTDNYFAIGSSHKHCEDYSLSGLKTFGEIENDAAYAIIADGCSGSKNTDFGSRIIAKCASNVTKWYYPLENSFRARVLEEIDKARNNLDLNSDCLDATLLYAQTFESEYEIRAYGDGGILKLKHDGDIEFTLIEYPSGAPLYLNYYLDTSRFSQYKEYYGTERKISKYLISSSGVELTEDFDSTGEPYIENGTNEYKVIAVTSDGIASFAKYLGKTCEMEDIVSIVKSVMDFKSVKGQFIERKMNKFNADCEKNSVKHIDDFSIAGISFERNVK